MKAPSRRKKPKLPTKKSKAVIERILDRMMSGESLRAICTSPKMPNLTTVLRWVRDDDVFFEQYKKAQEVRAELFVDEIMDLSKKATSKENADAIRVQIDTIKWASGKMKPKRFGDKLDITSDGERIINAIQINHNYPQKELE